MALDAHWVDEMLDGVGDEPATPQGFDSTGLAQQIRQIAGQQAHVGRSGVRRQVNALLEHMGEQIVDEPSLEAYHEHRMQFASVISDIRTEVPLSPEVSDYVVRFDHDQMMSRHFGVEAVQHFARNPRYVSGEALPDQQQVAQRFSQRYRDEAEALAQQPPSLYTSGRAEALSTMAEHTARLAQSPLPDGFAVDQAIRDVARQRVKTYEQRVGRQQADTTPRSDQAVSQQARSMQHEQGLVQGYYDALQIASGAAPSRVHSGQHRGHGVQQGSVGQGTSVDFSKGIQQKRQVSKRRGQPTVTRQAAVQPTRMEQSKDVSAQSSLRQEPARPVRGGQQVFPIFESTETPDDQPDRELN